LAGRRQSFREKVKVLETIKTIFEWAEAILTLLSGGMVYFFNILALFLGWLPWAISITLWNLARHRLSPSRAFAFGNATAGIIVAGADLSYRHYLNTSSSLRDPVNWISPFRGGQFMFLPLWLLGISTTVLASLYLAGRAKFLSSLLEDVEEQPVRANGKTTIDGPDGN
jgi:hypothetical protein